METKNFTAFRDFAHAPSKLRATTAGVKDSFPNRHLTAVFELHTFSSLNREFLPTYRDALARADEQVVYYDPEVLKHKKVTRA
jgi:UDP-N-acetylmuramate: L-alanyl-gamma-D-glutamyl-meso-diaminopimelate ligase